MNQLYRFAIILLIPLFLGDNASGQPPQRRVEILFANSLEYDSSLGESVRRLIGDVRLRHEGVIMNSDSAWLYDLENIVLAYGNVHFNQGDTLHLYGDFVRYSGDTKMAEVRGNVKLVDKETTLTTTMLDFDLNRSVGYYPEYGLITNNDNKLESLRGYYYTREKTFYFSREVVITNPEYTIYSDTLKYNTETEIAEFFGPTTIVGEELFAYTELGWYDQKTDRLLFLENSYIINDTQILKGDSLYYDRVIDFGEAKRNVEIRDTLDNVILKGEFATLFRDPERIMITNRAEFIQISDEDSLFLHADTLRSVIPAGEDYRILKAWYGARFFRADLQGKCDSLIYSFQDSVIHMYTQPVLWFEDSQLSSDTINIFTKNKKIDHMHMPSNSFMVSDEGEDRYSQVKGRELFGYFIDGKLDHLHMIGNVETIYFLKEEKEDKEELIGVNKAISQQLIIRIKDNKPDEIVFISNPEGTLYPPDYLSKPEMILDGFIWQQEIRPKSREDIFRRP